MSELSITAGIADKSRDVRLQGQIQPPPGTASGQVLTADGVGGSSWQPGAGASFYQTVQDEGVDLTQRAKLDFVGAGVTAADAGGVTTVTIPGVTALDYVESTATTVIAPGASAATAVTVITGSAIALSGTQAVEVIFFCSRADLSSTSSFVIFQLFDGATDICRLVTTRVQSTVPLWGSVMLFGARTPSAGNHQYIIKTWQTGSGNMTINPVPGGAPPGDVGAPTYLRVLPAS